MSSKMSIFDVIQRLKATVSI